VLALDDGAELGKCAQRLQDAGPRRQVLSSFDVRRGVEMPETAEEMEAAMD